MSLWDLFLSYSEPAETVFFSCNSTLYNDPNKCFFSAIKTYLTENISQNIYGDILTIGARWRIVLLICAITLKVCQPANVRADLLKVVQYRYTRHRDRGHSSLPPLNTSATGVSRAADPEPGELVGSGHVFR